MARLCLSPQLVQNLVLAWENLKDMVNNCPKGSSITFLHTTACGYRIAHRKGKETKQQPGTAGPGNMLGCSLISFHFLWAIHPIRPVQKQSIALFFFAALANLRGWLSMVWICFRTRDLTCRKAWKGCPCWGNVGWAEAAAPQKRMQWECNERARWSRGTEGGNLFLLVFRLLLQIRSD